MPLDASWRLGVVLPALPSEGGPWPIVIGRLRPGAIPNSAQGQLRRVIDPLLTAEYGVGRVPFRTFFRPVAALPAAVTDLHKMRLAASALILIIPCANVASLMLARGLRRSREHTVHFALGCTRGKRRAADADRALICALVVGAMGIIAAWIG